MILHGDCLEQMKTLEANSVDAIVTDPPYGISFMGKSWDYEVPSTDIWKEAFRVLKPGGHLLSFFGTRTYHRGVVRIEDAGFEIRDQIMWIYGSGFPKSHNIKEGDFKGWGTALKPANEPIVVARKPLEKGLTVAQNVLEYGTGALNIDESRIEAGEDHVKNCNRSDGKIRPGFLTSPMNSEASPLGRWPANILFDEAASEMLDEQSGLCKTGNIKAGTLQGFGKGANTYGSGVVERQFKTDVATGASRFFYVAKASKSERNKGLEGMPEKIGAKQFNENMEGKIRSDGSVIKEAIKHQNHHPTVKPIKLMEYLIKLVTPPKGTVLDPFMGSGSTGVACKNLGLNFIGCEMNDEYIEIAKRRIG